MAKKHRCVDCDNHMRWYLGVKPHDEETYEYAKRCVIIAERTIICGETMKTKSINHEQYCKKYRHGNESYCIFADTLKRMNDKDLNELKERIRKYEEENNIHQSKGDINE